MELFQDHIYEEIAATYQCLEIERLNDTLKKHGLDADLRRKICEEFIFSSGDFLDDCWFEADKLRVMPRICFVEASAHDPATGDLRLFVPCADFSFHEYAFGNSSWYFDDHAEDAGEIKRGQNVEP